MSDSAARTVGFMEIGEFSGCHDDQGFKRGCAAFGFESQGSILFDRNGQLRSFPRKTELQRKTFSFLQLPLGKFSLLLLKQENVLFF